MNTQTDDPVNHETLDCTWGNPFGLWGWFTIVNHKNIGIRYLVTAFIFFLGAGVLGVLMRVQLASPQNDFMGPDFFNQVFTVHGTVMMFLFAIPMVEGFAIYLVPLMIGTRDLCFPRLSAYSYYVFLIGGIALWISLFLGSAPDAGWFNYPTLALKEFSPSHRISVYATVISFIEVAALAAAVELIVTILKQRAPGMTLGRTSPFVWSILVAAIMIVFAMPGIVVASVMLAMDRLLETAFFQPALGGDVLLWQHLFWWFGHPEVYIIFLPATGIVSTIIPVFCGRPLFGYTAVVVAIISTGVISFGLWVHHMFATGLPTQADGFFAAASGLVALPTGIQFFAWLATIWGGRPVFKTPFLFCFGFISLFLIGGLTGVMVASIPFDLQVHDSYFVVAHFHYVLIGGVVFPIFGGIYYWWPKFTGRMLSERLGKLNFWMMFIGFNVAFFPMHNLGFRGMPRRIYTYLPDLGWDILNQLSTWGTYLLALGVLVLLINIVWSLRRGRPSGDNPWNADTLEWMTTSPPANYNFAEVPRITSLNPVWKDGPHPAPGVRGLREDAREIIITTSVEAEPQAVVELPGPSIWPFILAVISSIAFIGSIFSPWWYVAGFCGGLMAAACWFWPIKSTVSGKVER